MNSVGGMCILIKAWTGCLKIYICRLKCGTRWLWWMLSPFSHCTGVLRCLMMQCSSVLLSEWISSIEINFTRMSDHNFFGHSTLIWKLRSTYKLWRHSSHKSSTLWHRVSYYTDAGNSRAGMPGSGYLDKNDELIDSIAKATLAATSVTGVPWRRRTMDSWELGFWIQCRFDSFRSCYRDSFHKSF